MKIGIFETEHYEGSYPVIKLFDIPENDLYIFTSDNCYSQFSILFKDTFKHYQWIIRKKNASKYSFFWTFYRATKKNKLDVLYLNTISNNHLVFAFILRLLPKVKTVLTIHDINCLFLSKPGSSFREMVKHYGKKMLLKSISEFNVVSETMVEYLGNLDEKKRTIYHIPGAVFEGKQHQTNIAEAVNLVIIGSIDKKRRNYDEAFELLALAENLKLSLQLTFLGGYSDDYGTGIITKAKLFKCIHTRLVYFETDVVAQDKFDKIVDQSHFIFIPSVIQTKICGDIPEIYGITKSSGNIFDGIKHAKPIIIPQQLRVPQNIESSCFRYTSINELASMLQIIATNKTDYFAWQENALNNSKQFSIKNIRDENPGLFKP